MGTHHQPYFLEKAKEDLVHHSAAWVVKEPERSPIFVDCHAVEDPSLGRGSLGDAHDAARFAETLAGAIGAATMIPYNVFEEVVDEHDTNYLIALAICIDQLPDCVTNDEVSRRIRLNADQDMDERRGLTVREQDGPSVSLDELAEVYGYQAGTAEVEVALER